MNKFEFKVTNMSKKDNESCRRFIVEDFLDPEGV